MSPVRPRLQERQYVVRTRELCHSQTGQGPYLAVGAGGARLEVQGQIVNAARALLRGRTAGAAGEGRRRHGVLLSQRREKPSVS